MKTLAEEVRAPFGTNHVTAELIKQLERRAAEALCAADTDTLDRVWAQDYTLTTPSGQLVTKAEYLTGLRTGALRYRVLEIESLAVRDYDHTAIVNGRARVEGRFGGHETRGVDRYQTVYRWEDGRWQALATLATRVRQDSAPFSPPDDLHAARRA